MGWFPWQSNDDGDDNDADGKTNDKEKDERGTATEETPLIIKDASKQKKSVIGDLE